MTIESDGRALTRRGYKREDARVWPPDAATEDTAPSHADRVDVDAWAVPVDRAGEHLSRQMCPVCGEGPWKSPLNHVSRKHGVDRFTMRSLCGLTLSAPVADWELLERFAERGRQIDMSTVNHKGKPRKKQRWTEAGIQWQVEHMKEVAARPEAQEIRQAAARKSKTPEAVAKQAKTLRDKWAALTPEERRAKTTLPKRTPEEQSALARRGWEKRGVQPCGTVAAYKRGCRCDACREAKAASR